MTLLTAGAANRRVKPTFVSSVLVLTAKDRSLNSPACCRIQNGDDLGIDLEIIDIPGERLGRLSVCSQPLSTNREWLRDWVDHQFAIGADKVFMHVPKVRPDLSSFLPRLDHAASLA